MAKNTHNISSKTYSKYPHLFVFFVAVSMVMFEPSAALASWAGEGVICTLASFASGNIGKGIASISVITVALGALMGKVTWTNALLVAAGIGGLFGATELASFLVDHRNCSTPPTP